MSVTIDFSHVYTEHFEYVKKVCLRMVKDESVAEDVAQDAFVNVWRKLHTFNGTANVRTWLHRIAVNQSLMFLRSQPRIERLQLDDEVAQILPALGSHPRHKLALNRAIRKLSKGYQRIFLLREVVGYSHSEIADMLDVTEGTVKSQNFKARQHLRKSLQL